jgi:hypothetical protein
VRVNVNLQGNVWGDRGGKLHPSQRHPLPLHLVLGLGQKQHRDCVREERRCRTSTVRGKEETERVTRQRGRGRERSGVRASRRQAERACEVSGIHEKTELKGVSTGISIPFPNV